MAAEERKFQDPEYDYYDIEDEEEEGGRGPILVVVAIIVVTAFVGVVLVAYNQGVKEGRQQMPPILHADQSPVRETPPETASLEPSKSPSAQIFSPGKTPEAETMAPPPEEPMSPPKAAPPAEPAPTAPSASVQTPPSKGVEVGAAPEPTPTSPAIAKPAPVAAAAAPAAPAAAAPAATVAGSYLVQIGSFKSADEANATWEKIKAKNADILGSYAPNIITVDLGAKGTFQRLRFGPFDTKEAASGVCDQLKARKQDCLLAKQ